MYIITVQESLEDVVADVRSKTVDSESVWVARRCSDREDLTYYTFNVTRGSDNDVVFTSESDGVALSLRSSHKYELAVGEATYSLLTPITKVAEKANSVTCVAVTSDESKVLVGTSAGDIVQYSTADRKVSVYRREAHYLQILKLLVFPSDKVLLSVGDDFRAQLWLLDAIDEAPTRTFQKEKISDAALIGRGRNFVTSLLDGSVDVWECGSGDIVSTFRRIDDLADPATCVAVGVTNERHPLSSDKLFDCENAVLYVGYELGTIQQYNIAGHFQTKVRYRLQSAVTALCVVGETLVAGYANGEVVVYGETEHRLQLDLAHAVRHLHVDSTAPDLTFVLSNGPEVLLRVRLSGGTFTYSFLVGLDEMFRVQLVSGPGLVVATGDDVAFYR